MLYWLLVYSKVIQIYMYIRMCVCVYICFHILFIMFYYGY